MNITDQTIIYCETKTLADKVRNKYPNTNVTTNNMNADIYLFENEPSRSTIQNMEENRRSWFIKTDNKWHGHDRHTRLQKMSEKELIDLAHSIPAYTFAVSGILAEKKPIILNDDKIEPTDTEGHCYDMMTEINNTPVCAHNNIYSEISDSRALWANYICQTGD